MKLNLPGAVKKLFKKRKLFIFFTLFLLVYSAVNFAILLHFSKPGTYSYPIKKTWETLIVAAVPGELNKAKIHLNSAKSIYQDFETIVHEKSYKEARLSFISEELVYQEKEAFYHLEKAKEQGDAVKPTAKELCDLLEEQSAELKIALGDTYGGMDDLWNKVYALLDEKQKTTNDYLDRAMGW